MFKYAIGILSGIFLNSLSAQAQVQPYNAVYSDLNLHSNFTGFIDPVYGDQIEQRERR